MQKLAFRLRLFNLVIMSSALLINFSSWATEIYSHRGAAGLAPENTIPAIETALNIGVDVIDIDVGLTKDGVIVASHDPTLSHHFTQTIDGVWLDKPGEALINLTLADIKKHWVGQINPKLDSQVAEYRSQFPLQVAKANTTIPTLEEIIEFIKKWENKNSQKLDSQVCKPIKLQIEIKTSPTLTEATPLPEQIVPVLLKTLKAEDFLHRTEIHSFDWRNLLLIQQLEPQANISFISSLTDLQHEENKQAWHASYDLNQYGGSFPKMINQLGGRIWCPIVDELTLEDVTLAKQLGIKVVPWTVDDPFLMQKLIAWDVDGIITNRPDLLRGILAAHQKQVPKSCG